MSQYSHLTADLSNENSPATKIARLVGHDCLVLDLGSAHGYLAEALRRQGCRVIGVEIDPEDAARAQEHCEQVIVRSVEKPGWIDELSERQFDVVVLSDLIEHLRDPARVLREIRGLLKPEHGFIVASVPNVAHASIRLELLLGSFRSESVGILDATHLHFFTRDTLHDLLASSGFAVESWDCTTSEIGDPVIEDYLKRAGLSYTPELREQFGQFEAMAYQFIISARPATDPGRVPLEPITKPLKVMGGLIDDHQRLQTENQRLWRESERLGRENERLGRENERFRTPIAALEQPGDGRLRVLQVIHQFLPRHAAGAEIYCSDLSFALARRGHAVRVLCGTSYREDLGTSVQREGDTAIVVERVPANRTYRRLGSIGGFFDRFDNPDAQVALRSLFQRWRPDIVHIQHLLYHSAELIPECRSRRIPVVATLHDYWFLCHRVKLTHPDGSLCNGPARGWNCCQCLKVSKVARSHLNPVAVGANVYRYVYLIRQLLKVGRIIAPSRHLMNVFKRHGVPGELIMHCDYGTASPPADVIARMTAPRQHERVRFGFLSTFIYEKGVHVLVDAFSRLPAGRAELHLFGVPVDLPYYRDLQRRAHHPDIHWRGALGHADRWQALEEIDVLVVPSVWHENSPLTIHEAQIARVPVIGSAAGGIPELVNDGVTGLIFPMGNTNALEASLRKVIEDQDCLSRWRRAIAPPKSMETHVEEIERLYRELCSNRARTGDTR